MKKVILLLAVLLSASIVVDAAQSSTETYSSVSASSSQGRTVTVYKSIGNGNAKLGRKAEYFAETHTLKVGRETYRVMDNPNYGRSGVKFSEYPYCAGPYYFYL